MNYGPLDRLKIHANALDHDSLFFLLPNSCGNHTKFLSPPYLPPLQQRDALVDANEAQPSLATWGASVLSTFLPRWLPAIGDDSAS